MVKGVFLLVSLDLEDDGGADVVERWVEMHKNEVDYLSIGNSDAKSGKGGLGRGDGFEVGVNGTRGVVMNRVEGLASGDASTKGGFLEVRLESLPCLRRRVFVVHEIGEVVRNLGEDVRDHLGIQHLPLLQLCLILRLLPTNNPQQPYSQKEHPKPLLEGEPVRLV